MKLVHWLLAPYLLCGLAFLVAFIVMYRAGTNRTTLDLNLGTVGFGMLIVGGVCTVIMLFTFPYGSGTTAEWVGFSLHFVMAIVCVVVACTWLANHIA